MKLLKLLVHSFPAALLFALLLALLLFYLSPRTALDASSVWRAVGPLAALYGVAVWVAWPVGLLALRFFAERPLELSWFRFELFHRFHLINTAIGAAVWWGNYVTTRSLLPAASHRLLLAGCGMITLVCALGGLLSLQRVMFRTPRPRLAQGILVLVLFGGLFGLRAGGGGDVSPARGELRAGPAPARGRVVLVAIEGLSPEFVLPLAAEGRLPNLDRMMREGARAHVQSFAPALTAAEWTTVATGVLPSRHGIVDRRRWVFPPGRLQIDLSPRFLAFGLLEIADLVDPLPLSARDRRVPALWNVLDAARLDTGVVGWPVTEPGERLRGTMIPPSALGPADAADVAERLDRLADWGDDPEGAGLQAAARQSLGEDLAALAQAEALMAGDPPEVLLVYLPGLRRVQDRFLGKAFPPALRWRPGPADPAYGEVIARYHRFLDDAVSGLLDSDDAEPRLVIVASCSGTRRPAPWRLLLGRLTRWRWLGPHGRPPAGLLLAAGTGVARGSEVATFAPEDILPTLAYYVGLPVARNLDGRPRTDLFDEAFTRRRLISYIPAYRRP